MDLGRCIAAICVIAIHVSGVFCKDSSASAFYLANIVNGFSRFSVPAFFMFSGYLLCGRPTLKPTSYVFSKVVGLVKVYLFASLAYYLFDRFYQRQDMKSWPVDFLAGHAHFHLWFIPALIAVYFFYPLFMRILDEDKKYVFVFVVVSIILINLSGVMVVATNSGTSFQVESSLGPLYFLLGFCADSIFRFSKKICWFIFLAASFAIAAISTLMAARAVDIPLLDPGLYTGVLVFTQALAFFMMIKDVKIQATFLPLLSRVAKLILGIYIFHHAFMVFVFDALNHIGGFSQSEIVILAIPLVFLFSALFTAAIRKINFFSSFL